MATRSNPPALEHVARRKKFLALGLLSLWLHMLGGCASSGSSSGTFLDKALEIVGLQQPKPELPPDALQNLPTLTKKVTLRIHAGETLNTDPAGRSLSLVAKIYKLKSADPFLQTPYDTYKDTPDGKPCPSKAWSSPTKSS